MIKFDIFGMKFELRYSGFQRCKKHWKRLKWSDFTGKLNWYIKIGIVRVNKYFIYYQYNIILVTLFIVGAVSKTK